MTEKDLYYLNSLFSSWEVATISRYNKLENSTSNKNRLTEHLKRLDDLKKKIILQHNFVMNSLAFPIRSNNEK